MYNYITASFPHNNGRNVSRYSLRLTISIFNLTLSAAELDGKGLFYNSRTSCAIVRKVYPSEQNLLTNVLK